MYSYLHGEIILLEDHVLKVKKLASHLSIQACLVYYPLGNQSPLHLTENGEHAHRSFKIESKQSPLSVKGRFIPSALT